MNKWPTGRLSPLSYLGIDERVAYWPTGRPSSSDDSGVHEHVVCWPTEFAG